MLNGNELVYGGKKNTKKKISMMLSRKKDYVKW